jgi:hypothetical protein
LSNLALSAVVLLGLGLPGLLVYYRYLVATQQWEISGSNEFATPQAIAFAILVSLAFHSVWIAAISKSGYRIEYNTLLALLVHDNHDSGAGVRIDDWRVYGVTTYLVSQSFAAWFLGPFLAWAADRIGWSKHLALRSNGAVWHRLLRFPNDGREVMPEGPILTVMYTENSRTFLYRGTLSEYQLDPGGRLARLVLDGAFRRVLPDNLEQLIDPDDHKSWIEIPGEKFVVNCERVHQIEVDYVWLEEQISSRVGLSAGEPDAPTGGWL